MSAGPKIPNPPPLFTPLLGPGHGGSDDVAILPGRKPAGGGSSVPSKPWGDWFALEVHPALRTIPQPQVGSHAARLIHPRRIDSSAQLVPQGSFWYESDRKVTYASNQGAWNYFAGTMFGLAANRPADLGPLDAGFPFFATDSGILSLWTGTAWVNP